MNFKRWICSSLIGLMGLLTIQAALAGGGTETGNGGFTDNARALLERAKSDLSSKLREFGESKFQVVLASQGDPKGTPLIPYSNVTLESVRAVIESMHQ